MAEFIEAVNAANNKQRIPAAWLDHPVIGKDFRLTKRAEKKAEPEKKAAAKETPEKG